MSKIDSKELSIVVQGQNVPKHTENCLKSLRRNFPDAEIIFSTYVKEKVKGLDYDVLVQSEDPLAYKFGNIMSNNINRILTTTKAGLEKANRKYCLKIRSDLIAENDKLLEDIAGKFPMREEKYAAFKQRVIFYALWSRKYEYILDRYLILCPFHLSDWLCFGLTEDIKNFFMDIPLTKEPQYSEYFKNPKNRNLPFYDPDVSWKFPPEQYFTTHFFKKFFPEAYMKSRLDFSEKKMEFSRRVFASNVIVCSYTECGFYIQKKTYANASKYVNYLKGIWLGGVYRFGDFLTDYKKYCDPSYKIPLYYLLTNNYDIDNEISKLHKHWRKFTGPFRYLLKWCEQIVSLAFYVFKIIFKSGYVFFNALKQK